MLVLMVMNMISVSKMCQRFIKDESGIALVYTVLIMVPILVMAGFAIDSGYVAYLKVRLQNAADAAALAGANVAPNRVTSLTPTEQATIVSSAQTYSSLNMPTSLYGSALSSADIEIGYWDEYGDLGSGQMFHQQSSLPVGTKINAIKITTSLSQAKGNAASLNLMKLAGFQQMDLSASAVAAIARAEHMQCLDNGFVALGTMESNSNNKITGSAACFYGRDGVKLNSNSCFGLDGEASRGVVIAVSDLTANFGSGGIHYNNNNVVNSTQDCLNSLLVGEDISTAFDEVDINTSIADVDNFVFNLSKPSGDIAHTQAIVDLIAAYQLDPSVFPSGLNPPVSYTSNQTLADLNNAIVFVDGDIKFVQGSTIVNSYVMATGSISMPANGVLGEQIQCDEFDDLVDSNQVFIMAGVDIKFAANPSLFATQLVAGQDIRFTANGGSAGGISVLSGGDIKFTSNWTMTSCAESSHFLEFDEDEDRRVAGQAVLVN